ncbi:MAG: pyruvate kinase [Agathobacter sp.]|nr:pyruvate kinase [Agathobacter sp.]
MKTEIFGTFGPACASEEKIKEMIKAGMTGMRLNLSHSTLSASENYIEAYRNVAKELEVEPQILIDMQGPELRIGTLEGSMDLAIGERIVFGDRAIPIPEGLMDVMQAGDEVLLDDGKILAEVIGEDGTLFPGEKCVVAQVRRAGILQSHKSIKITGKNIAMPVLTEHDLANIKQARDYGVTALMQPFVLNGEDLRYVRSVLKEHGAEDIKIFAKIENRLGVENLENILPEADVIVIARGDLGNDMPLWELPRVQKEIELACHKAGKPYIVVTQMLASMENNPVPTRAEVSDIFHAVFHGAYGIMVTGETAVGKYPVAAIQYLANTAKEAENF